MSMIVDLLTPVSIPALITAVVVYVVLEVLGVI